MIETRTTRDPSGRVVITESDDRDTGYPIIVSSAVNVRGINAYSELVRLPLERARRGNMLLSSTVALNAAFVRQFACIELNIVGYIASAPTVLLSTAMDANINLLSFTWEEPDSYSAIGIEARQCVNGLPDGDVTGIDALEFSVAGTYWR